MKKTAKKWISVLLCMTLIAAGSVCAFADTERAEDTAALTDGSYTIGAVTDSTGAGRMFHIAQADNDTCKLEVKDGKIVPYEAGAVKTDKTRAKRNGKRNGNYLKL